MTKLTPEEKYMKEAIRQAKKRQHWEMCPSAVSLNIREKSLLEDIIAVWQTKPY